MLDWDTIDDLAAELGVKPDARRKWRERAHVPWRWRPDLIRVAEQRGVKADFDDIPTQPEAA